jgi:hypothetical protein
VTIQCEYEVKHEVKRWYDVLETRNNIIGPVVEWRRCGHLGVIVTVWLLILV